MSNLFQLGVVVVVDVADVDVADDANDDFHDGTFGLSSALGAAVVVEVEAEVEVDDDELPYDEVLP